MLLAERTKKRYARCAQHNEVPSHNASRESRVASRETVIKDYMYKIYNAI